MQIDAMAYILWPVMRGRPMYWWTLCRHFKHKDQLRGLKEYAPLPSLQPIAKDLQQFKKLKVLMLSKICL